MEKAIVVKRKFWITRNGLGVSPNHVIEQDGAEYHQAKQEERFVILQGCIIGGCSIVCEASTIVSDVAHDHPQLTIHIHTTRKYKRNIDKTYFKYFDDAKEVLDNFITTLEWIEKEKKEIQWMARKKRGLLKKYLHLLERPSLPEEILALKIESNLKTRENLDSFQRDLADERDLVVAAI